MRRSVQYVTLLSRGVQGLDLDFLNARYALNGPYGPAFPAGWTFVRADSNGTATAFQNDGSLVQFATGIPRITNRGMLVEVARTNLIQGSAAPATQSRTVTAAAHTLSFYGTGSITLSGASTAGPLNGTGANNRVSLTFTPSAGSLTMTVSGDVRDAQLELGAFASSPFLAAAASGSRGVDFPRVTNLATLFGQPFTVVSNTESLVGNTGVLPAPFSVSNDIGGDNGGAANRFLVYRTGTTFVLQSIRNNTVSSVNGTAPQNALTGAIRMALAWDGSTIRWATNGLAGTDLTPTDTFSAPLNRLDVGRGSGDATTPTGSATRQVRVLPYAASASELIALTA